MSFARNLAGAAGVTAMMTGIIAVGIGAIGWALGGVADMGKMALYGAIIAPVGALLIAIVLLQREE